MTSDMDQNLAYMYLMVEEAEGYHIFNRKTLEEYGSKVALFPGVKDWFERIRTYGLEQGVIVEHYINVVPTSESAETVKKLLQECAES